MNILFVLPLNVPFGVIFGSNPTISEIKTRIKNQVKCMYPNGLLSISSYIKKHNPTINIKILDLNAVIYQLDLEEVEDFEKFIEKSLSMLVGHTPDIIGISTLFSNVYIDLEALTVLLKRAYSKSLIVCGGHMVTALYKRVYEDNFPIDAICFGEGEIPMLEFIKYFKAGAIKEYLSLSSSWVTKEKASKNTILTNNMIIDLDEIPPMDLSTLVLPDVYFHLVLSFFKLDSAEPKGVLMVATRGCPYHCIFCASHQVHGREVRNYSASRVKEDILLYNKKYGITKFLFYDDHFLHNKKRAIEILDFIAEQNFTADIATPAFFSINEDVVKALKRVGMKTVNITVESGNAKTLKNIIHKPAELKKANEVVDLMHKEGLFVMTNIMVGLPGETKESIESGLTYLLTTKFNWFSCNIATPLPGSEFYEICKKNNYLVASDSDLLMNFRKCVVCTESFTPEYIEEKIYEMNLKLNFINNYDFRTGNYEMALLLFEKIINTISDTHAFAYYFASKCCEKLHLEEKRKLHMAKYEEIIEKDPVWKNWADKLLKTTEKIK